MFDLLQSRVSSHSPILRERNRDTLSDKHDLTGQRQSTAPRHARCKACRPAYDAGEPVRPRSIRIKRHLAGNNDHRRNENAFVSPCPHSIVPKITH